MQWKEVEFRWANRERRWQYKRLEAELRSVKSLKYYYHLPTKMQEGNVFQASVILSMGAMYHPHHIVGNRAVHILLQCCLV